MIVYGYFNDQEECLYIGIDSTGERHKEHLKFSRQKESKINTYLQTHENWDYRILAEIEVNTEDNDANSILRLIESYYLDKYETIYNISKMSSKAYKKLK